MTGGGIRGGEILNRHVERTFQPEVQPGFRIHSNLFTFRYRFNTDACSSTSSASDHSAFTAAGDPTDDSSNRGTNSSRFCGLYSL